MSHLGGLRRLKLSYGNMPDLASLLALGADEPVEPSRATPCRTFVPALEQLNLFRITFREKDTLSGNATSRKALPHALSTRRALRPQLVISKFEGDEYESESLWDDYREQHW